MGHGAAWAEEGVPAMAGDWDEMGFEVPANPYPYVLKNECFAKLSQI